MTHPHPIRGDKAVEKSGKISSPVVLKSVAENRSRKELKMLKRENKKQSKNTDAPEATQREIKIGGTILRMAEASFVDREKLFDNENQYIKYEGKTQLFSMFGTCPLY